MGGEEKTGARALPRYARLLGAPQGRAQREAAEAARACLVAMRFRFPEALFLVELVIRLGEVGAFDLAGSVKQIADMIGEILGESPPDPVKLQRSLRALDGRTRLVEKQSRQRWRLRLAGISDPASERHRLLLEETPSPYRLGGAVEQRTEQHNAEAGAEVLALRQRLQETASKAHEAEVERDTARFARADLEEQLQAVRAELANVDGQVDVLRRERDATEAQRAALTGVRDVLAQRVGEQEKDLAELRARLAEREGELLAERQRQRRADEARTSGEGLPGAIESQAVELRRLEEAVLERDIALEDAERRLSALRAEVERVEAAANARVEDAQAAAAEEMKRSAGLKAILKDERERRRATEARFRRLLTALRSKIVGDEVTDLDLERDEVCFLEIRRVLEEYVLAKDDERQALAREPEHDGDLDQLGQDVRLGRTLGRLITQMLDEEFAQSER